MRTSHATIDLAGATSVGQNPRHYNPSDFDTRGKSSSAVVAFGLWLRVGVGAAGLLLIGTIQFINREHEAYVSMGIVAGAVALLLAAWHYARLALHRMEQSEASATPSVAGNGGRSTREPIVPAYRREYALD
jgi:hypothetical protein